MNAAVEIGVTTVKHKPCHFQQREKPAVDDAEQKQISHPMKPGSK
jgi:hypothetical protein